jgi:alanine racemase
MVKADAYGLGLAGVAAALSTEDPWGFGVSAVEEGMALRALGVRLPVLVLTPVPPGSVGTAVEAGLTISVSHQATLALLAAAAARSGAIPSFHLEIDTGMGRAGFDWRLVDEWAPRAHTAHAAGLRWTGCFTHMHSADSAAESVREQWSRFQHALERAGRPEGDFLVHALNSAGVLRCPEYAADAVRPGIFLYGGAAAPELQRPEPVIAVRARVVHVRDAPPGTTLGYGSTYQSSGSERWASVAIGHGDGIPRTFGRGGTVLVRGRRVPVVGRISMDVTVLDITGVSGVEAGEVATFIGDDGSEGITLDELAEAAGTISYEILTGFTPRLERIWLDDRHGP